MTTFQPIPSDALRQSRTPEGLKRWTKPGTLRDYWNHEVQQRQWRAARTARRLGLIDLNERRSFHPRLPKNLCQYEVRAERSLADASPTCFFEALERRHRVYLLTVVHPDWFVEGGKLSPDDFRGVRNWISRRARSLQLLGQQRLLGCVDIAWEDRRALGGQALWSVHAHALVCVEARGVRKEEIRPMFHAPPLPPGSGASVQLKRLRTDLDVLLAREYATRAMLLHCGQYRSHYLSADGQPACRKRDLPTAQDTELAQVLMEMGPRGRWLLSGLRMGAEGIRIHDGTGTERR
jgi:hypothetical protein